MCPAFSDCHTIHENGYKRMIIGALYAVSIYAQVAKLVDAPGSGPGGSNTVEIRVLSWAPIHKPLNVTVEGFFVANMDLVASG